MIPGWKGREREEGRRILEDEGGWRRMEKGASGLKTCERT